MPKVLLSWMAALQPCAPCHMTPRAALALQSQVAGLEREIQLAQRQIDLERSKQEELVRERERWGQGANVGLRAGKLGEEC